MSCRALQSLLDVWNVLQCLPHAMHSRVDVDSVLWKFVGPVLVVIILGPCKHESIGNSYDRKLAGRRCILFRLRKELIHSVGQPRQQIIVECTPITGSKKEVRGNELRSSIASIA